MVRKQRVFNYFRHRMHDDEIYSFLILNIQKKHVIGAVADSDYSMLFMTFKQETSKNLYAPFHNAKNL